MKYTLGDWGRFGCQLYTEFGKGRPAIRGCCLQGSVGPGGHLIMNVWSLMSQTVSVRPNELSPTSSEGDLRFQTPTGLFNNGLLCTGELLGSSHLAVSHRAFALLARSGGVRLTGRREPAGRAFSPWGWPSIRCLPRQSQLSPSHSKRHYQFPNTIIWTVAET